MEVVDPTAFTIVLVVVEKRRALSSLSLGEDFMVLVVVVVAGSGMDVDILLLPPSFASTIGSGDGLLSLVSKVSLLLLDDDETNVSRVVERTTNGRRR